MRPVPQSMTDAWMSEDKSSTRPVVRATIQRLYARRWSYDTAHAEGGDWGPDKHRRGNFTSVIFGQVGWVTELRNIKSCSWSRSLDQDVATCTLVLENSEITPIGQVDDEKDDQFDQPGAFTYSRNWSLKAREATGSGTETDSGARWGYDKDRGWQNLIVPDRMVKTYEGYGQDPSVTPALDENLVQTGTWLIDKVTYTNDGEITIEMRDVGRMLLTSIVFPPIIPYDDYPLTWSVERTENVPARDAMGGKWVDLYGIAKATSSNNAYIGKGLTDPPYPYYVSDKGAVDHRTATMALKRNNLDPGQDPVLGVDGKYWESTGQTSRDSFVWWQADFFHPQDIAAIRIDPAQGPYKIFISIKTDNGWVGKKRIPYEVTTEGIDNGADIPFVQAVWQDRIYKFDVILKRKYSNVRAIRLTFTHLAGVWTSKNYPWRARLDWVRVYAGKYDELHFGKGTKLKVVGNYEDYTQIVRWVCAWGGFFWPPRSTGDDYQNLGRSQTVFMHYDHYDQWLPKGRVWGDFQRSGTQGEVDLTVDLFDKKPLMDVINYIRDILGFVFFIDETGAVVWRMPNLFSAGNYTSPEPAKMGNRITPTRTQDYVTLDEKTTLQSISTTLDSDNVRDRIFVANTTGKIGVVIRPFMPTLSGLRRIAGWTDQHFASRRETVVMADMISAQQMFSWRRSTITTPGYPAIQMDDQIRVFERMTNDTYWHYVLGISSENNMEEGTWTYTLTTHWLGENRSDAWVVDVDKMDMATQNYLNVLKGTSDMKD